ncbi:PaaI family thioesterase [Verticiella sediminum]|uniref:PaaI family thioesterase n=1 Tax=Verticiella sediminum TaxID=1247510 RepID=A0A556AYX3_9BURK|nr:PaaI family thioesterase [Verticiella sediminum]TSH98137.1 PaaI family thioesterase [Verticiella sediminum]
MSTQDPIDYFGISVPLMQYLGLRPEQIGEDYCRTCLTLRPELTNSRGDIHGGTLMAIFDFTMSAAARGHAPHSVGVMTIEMSTHFLEAATGDIIIEGRCIRRGRSIAFCEGTITSEDGEKRVAVARATFKLVQRRDV